MLLVTTAGESKYRQQIESMKSELQHF